MNIQNKEQWDEAFIKACQNGEIEDVRHLCQKKYLDLGWADIHCDDEYGFHWACANGHMEIVKYLLTSPELIEAGHTFSNLHADNEEGFRMACRRGHLDVVKYLLTSKELKEAGHTFADLHANDEEGLRKACANGQLDVVKYLLTSTDLIEAGHTFADMRANGKKVVQKACEHGQWNLVRWLVMDYGLEKSNGIKKIIKDYPQAQEYFRVREEMRVLDEAMNRSMNNGLVKTIQSKVESFVKIIQTMGSQILFKKQTQSQLENKMEASKKHEESENDKVVVKQKTKRL